MQFIDADFNLDYGGQEISMEIITLLVKNWRISTTIMMQLIQILDTKKATLGSPFQNNNLYLAMFFLMVSTTRS